MGGQFLDTRAFLPNMKCAVFKIRTINEPLFSCPQIPLGNPGLWLPHHRHHPLHQVDHRVHRAQAQGVQPEQRPRQGKIKQLK